MKRVCEDILEEKNKRQSKKKGLVSEDIYWEKKTDYYKQKIIVSEYTLLGWKKNTQEIVRTFLKRKTRDYQRKKVWWVRTSIERKKNYYKQNIMLSEDTLLGCKKKSLGNGEWGHSWREKQKTIKEKRSGEWGHLLREKKDYYKQKIMVSEDTLLGWKKILGKWWGHSWRKKQKTIKEKRSGEWGHLLREKKD